MFYKLLFLFCNVFFVYFYNLIVYNYIVIKESHYKLNKKIMTQEIINLREKAETAKFQLKYNQITLEQAKEQAQPYIDVVNKKASEVELIAKSLK